MTPAPGAPMKPSLLLCCLAVAAYGCEKTPPPTESSQTVTNASAAAPPATTPIVVPKEGPKNVIHIAASSKDHSTLVTALQTADYVDSLTNPGPFTVFAPTNAAFEKLPKGTVESLLTPAKQGDLKKVLQHHVAVSVYQLKDFKDGQVLGMADGGKVTLHVKDGKVAVNGANIVASVAASNGIVHVVDTVVLPE